MSDYRYFNGDTKHPYEFKACPTCNEESWIQKRRTFCSRKCSKSGALNPTWKGDDAGYLSMHTRVYRLRGSADSCVFGCEGQSKYDWANLLGNYEDPNDYAMMCRTCHASFDHAIAKCFDKTCKRGHTMNNDTMYVKIKDGKEVRQCKQCAKDRARDYYRDKNCT